jgi:hypothetical protein
MHACAVDRAVHPAHGSTVNRTEGVSLGFDRRRGSAIQRPRMRATGSGGGARRCAAARSGGLAGAALTRAAVHQNLHERVQNVARLLAHVTRGSRGSLVPRRRPAPEGGGAAAPARSRVRR